MKQFAIIMALLAMALPVKVHADKTEYYAPKSYTYEGITLPYRQLNLNDSVPGSYQLVIQLHGGSARGDDNVAQLNASAVDSVEQYLRLHQRKAIFLLPQCGADRVWNENTNTYAVTMTDVLKHWLSDFVQSHDVDSTQIYITGYSAGGSGTWRMLNDNHTTFAAALVAAANPVMVTADQVRHTPVYAIAGSNDALMDANRIRAFVQQLQQLGCDAAFTLLQGKDHFGTCDTAFTRERLDWMFAHRRPAATPLKGDVNTDGKVNVSDVTTLINIILGIIH